MSLTVVTTTRQRPACFALLEKWMSRQTLKPEKWLVINDSPQPDNYIYTQGQTVIVRKPRRMPAQENNRRFIKGTSVEKGNSLLLNWLKALPLIETEKIVVCEDDDWYHEDYLRQLSAMLDEASLVGVSGGLYYKLPIRKFIRLHNSTFAGLGATGLRRSLLGRVEHICNVECKANNNSFIDMYLWLTDVSKSLVVNKAPDGRAWHVGFKQMPGAKGLGIGHANDGSNDCNWQVLTQWVGREDAKVYREFAKKELGVKF